MRNLFIAVAIVASFSAFASDLPYEHLKFKSYSNVKDPVFKKIHTISNVSNYWDSVRRSMVYSASCSQTIPCDEGFLYNMRFWVEMDRVIVDWSDTYTFSPNGKKENNSTEKRSIVQVMIDEMSNCIKLMDGNEIIDSTTNIRYRGDSAVRLQRIYKDWLAQWGDKKAEEMLQPYFGVQWKVANDCYIVKYFAGADVLGGMFFMVTKFSDRRIEFDPFNRTDTLKEQKDNSGKSH